MIWRDDDINCDTDLAVFKPIHQHFRNALVMHTVAIICKDFDQNTEVINFIKANNIDPQLHCWEHYSFPDNLNRLNDDIPKCLDMFAKIGFDRPTTLYPPWNKSSYKVREIAAKYGLTVSNEKVSLSQYLRAGGDVEESVINFHHWDSECEDLPAALKLYNKRR